MTAVMSVFMSILPELIIDLGFPSGSDGKESACTAGDADSIPGSGRSLEKGMDRGARQATVHGIAKSWPQWSD